MRLKPLPRFKSLISVSSDGRVCHTLGDHFEFAQRLEPNGMRVQWRMEQRFKFNELVHRLVAEVWVYNHKPGKYKWVHHWDRDKTHNDYRNLYWGKLHPWPYKKRPLILIHERDRAIKFICNRVQVDDITKCWTWIVKRRQAWWNGRNIPIWWLPWTLWKGYVWPNTRAYTSCGNKKCINPDHIRVRMKCQKQ